MPPSGMGTAATVPGIAPAAASFAGGHPGTVYSTVLSEFAGSAPTCCVYWTGS